VKEGDDSQCNVVLWFELTGLVCSGLRHSSLSGSRRRPIMKEIELL
jgi:hypothetical protein